MKEFTPDKYLGHKINRISRSIDRDAGNGENLFNGEYLINAQGEDVVAGIRTPQQITKIASQRWLSVQVSLKRSVLPSILLWKRLCLNSIRNSTRCRISCCSDSVGVRLVSGSSAL